MQREHNNSRRRSLSKALASALQQQQAHRVRLEMEIRLHKAEVEANNDRTTDWRSKVGWAHGKYKRAGIYATRPRT